MSNGDGVRGDGEGDKDDAVDRYVGLGDGGGCNEEDDGGE